jgi:hypothetical protein
LLQLLWTCHSQKNIVPLLQCNCCHGNSLFAEPLLNISCYIVAYFADVA